MMSSCFSYFAAAFVDGFDLSNHKGEHLSWQMMVQFGFNCCNSFYVKKMVGL